MHAPIRQVVDALGQRVAIPFAVQAPDGEVFRAGTGEPRFTIRFRSAVALRALLLRGYNGLLDAYFDRSIDIDGDLGAALAAGTDSGFWQRFSGLAGVENGLHELRHSNRSFAQAKAKANARAHYGLDHVCRKLRLSRRDRFVDIGCGFGGFMFRAWEIVGASGTGVNTTTERVRRVREEIERRGLAHALTVREADFREVDAQYDEVVSIGVLEHAGRGQLAAEVVRAHAEFLRPGGLGMLKLDAWAERFERRWPEIRALDPHRLDERFRRIWRIYLVDCAQMFRACTSYTHLFQVLFSKGKVSATGYPMTRARVYAT